MKYKYVPLKKENDLNKILKVQKNTEEKFHIFFHSLWDNISTDIVTKLTNKYDKQSKYTETVYGVDSFNLPHSFVIFSTTKIPALVSLEKNKVIVEDYPAMIYKKLRI